MHIQRRDPHRLRLRRCCPLKISLRFPEVEQRHKFMPLFMSSMFFGTSVGYPPTSTAIGSDRGRKAELRTSSKFFQVGVLPLHSKITITIRTISMQLKVSIYCGPDCKG
ncbi:hypothetical protein L1987_76547 [Smallanthus sonchifolius]|uniref:Uncharacterized protein n=1 Tax=Smallanthus sonchifolius TaxID=185202 RepID=A0ACB8Z8K4_9ASTR|nr:hypothetical protein L1987_76547 [Smallanthus sonchifolius]